MASTEEGRRASSFELFLLSAMRADRQVRAALDHLGASPDRVRQAVAEVEAAGFLTPGHSAELYREWLGEPIALEPPPPTSDHDASAFTRLRFRFTSWPDFDFAVGVHADGWASEPCFLRRHGVPTPRIVTAADLRPWRFVRAELDARFGEGRLADGWENSRDLVYATGADAGALDLHLAFDYGLLQVVPTHKRS